MIVADIQSIIGLVVAILMFFLAVAGFGVGMMARLVFRRVRDGYREEGGAKGMARKIATKGAAELVKRVILKKR
jgi:hypothetical protein